MAKSSFDRILDRLEDTDPSTEKTASETAPETTPEAQLIAQVEAITSEKTASETPTASPVTDLQAMAKQAHDAEQDHLVKEAHLLGSAIADGFMERYAQYDNALNEAGVKTADAPAALSEQAIANAAAQGYKQAAVDMEKQAAASYEQGYNDQMQAVHKIASEVHYAGQTVANKIVADNRPAS